jgi:hypothetical protein
MDIEDQSIVYVPAGTLPKTTHGRNGFLFYSNSIGGYHTTIAIVASLPPCIRRYVVVGHGRRRRRRMTIVSNTHTPRLPTFWSAPNIFAG